MSILKNQNGQGIMEYLILTTLVGMVCLGAVKNFGQRVEKRIERVEKGIQEKIKF